MQEVRDSAIIRQSDIIGLTPPITSFFDLEDEMDLNFMDTFDHTVTQGDMEWGKWARQNRVDERVIMGGEHFLLMTFLGFSSYIKNDWNRADRIDSIYFVECELHNGESEYIDFLFFILSVK